MKSSTRFLVVLVAACCWINLSADELPRKVDTPRESYRDAEVTYDFVVGARGERLRTIITKPRRSTGKLPVIFVAGWLSCDSVEAAAGTKDESGIVFQHLAELPGFCLFRVDKAGVGDSEGTCSETDFSAELAGYRAAFRALKKYDFIDTSRVYLLGISNGGGFAPLLPETEAERAQVRGYIVVGAWVKTWFEHMLEIERRRFALMGKSPGQLNDSIKGISTLYYEWLIAHRKVADILREHPQLVELWPEGKDREHLYGRPLRFYEQLQELNLATAWGKVSAPTLVLHGQYDWIMTRQDNELIAEYVNANRADAARFVEVPEMGHTFQHYLSWADAFRGKPALFDEKPVKLIVNWLKEQLGVS